MRFIGFIGPSYTMRSVNVDCQRCINLYPEINEIGSGKEREVAALIGTPGLSLLATVGTGANRGSWRATNGTLYVVTGTKLYSVSSTWTSIELGTLLTTSGQVSIADNGLQLMIVDGTYGYTLNLTTAAFAQITDPDFPGADQVVYLDGYFVFNKPNSQQFMFTSLNSLAGDATDDYEALDLGSSEGLPDKIVGLVTNNRDLWLFNQHSTEVFYNSGAADLPFERVQGSFIEIGCAARFSIAKLDNAVYWLGQDKDGHGSIYRAQGYQPIKISTTAVEFAIQEYGDLSTSVAYTYQDAGHKFYVINFPTAKTTWVFDAVTNLWHERTYNNAGTMERHRANSHSFAYSKHVVTDYENGKIYELSNSVYTDDTVEIIRRRVTPHMSESLSRIFYQFFQLDMETGTGLDGLGQGIDPQAMLQFSDDGGHTWSNELWTGFGKIGQKKKRALWRRLGSSRDRVWRITITDPVKVVLIGAEIGLGKGES